MTYTITKAADMVGIKQSYFWQLVRREKLIPAPKVKVGLRKRYDDAGIEAVKQAVADLKEAGRFAQVK